LEYHRLSLLIGFNDGMMLEISGLRSRKDMTTKKKQTVSFIEIIYSEGVKEYPSNPPYGPVVAVGFTANIGAML